MAATQLHSMCRKYKSIMVNCWSTSSLSNRRRLQEQRILIWRIAFYSQLSTLIRSCGSLEVNAVNGTWNYPIESWHNAFLTGTSSLYQQGQGSASTAKMTKNNFTKLLKKASIGSPAFTKKEIISSLIDKLCTIFLVMYLSPYPPVFDDLLFSKAGEGGLRQLTP